MFIKRKPGQRVLLITTPAREANHVDVANRACSFDRSIRSLVFKLVFQSVQVLLTETILATGKRTVTAVLRVMGLAQHTPFQTCHRVLTRAAWSTLTASRILLLLLMRAFAPEGPLIFGLDDTIERRWGAKIAACGIYRDPVRSSQSHFVKASGLRWLCMMLLWCPSLGRNGSEPCLS